MFFFDLNLGKRGSENPGELPLIWDQSPVSLLKPRIRMKEAQDLFPFILQPPLREVLDAPIRRDLREALSLSRCVPRAWDLFIG